MPFNDTQFDAALSCGVLEHVPDENGSLDEIHRVLKPNGAFFIFNLPQKHSYKEFLIERFRMGYTHERKYTANSIGALLTKHGFHISAVRRGGMLPHNMTGIPARVRDAYNRAAYPILFADQVPSKLPLLNRIGETIEIVANPDAIRN